MKWLESVTRVAVIAGGVVYLGGCTAQAADQNSLAATAERIAFNACKDAVLEADMQGGYLGDDITKATAKTLRSDRCMLKYPQLNNPNTGSALDQGQRRARLSQQIGRAHV